jgi:CRISPR/Cas system CSM-associated protein Csm3 (group 7 of RAMP superfamily)
MAKKDNRYKDRIIGKIILQATLRNESPLLIGRGGGDAVDIEVMQLPEGKPYIPGSSIAGSLKSFLNGQDGYFWGQAGKKDNCAPLQSHIRFDDLIPVNFTGNEDIVIRDGVKIDHQTGTAEDGNKYDYQIVEPGLVFSFRAEVTLRDSMKAAEDFNNLVASIKTALEHPEFRLGANTNTGFGKMTCENFQAYHFQFPEQADAWFEYLNAETFSIPALEVEPKDLPVKDSFSIQSTFRLKSSLMIGAYGTGKGNEPDKSQLKSRGKFVLPGKSIRGAIRHRAVKIWKILGKSDDQFEDLFGIVDEEQGKQKRSRLRIDEFLFKDEEVRVMIQNRIRIDRFTGGVISGALFNSEPVWTTGQENIRLTFTILKEASADEKKLLLLLLKDLWLEDLAIGGEKNVGRGILVGQEAIIYENGAILAAFHRNGDGPGLNFTEGSAYALNQLFEHKTETA